MARNFMELLRARWTKGLFSCVGLDSDWNKIPACVKEDVHQNVELGLFHFNALIVDTTKDMVAAYKPNSAFYEQWGQAGYSALEMTINYIHDKAPDVPVILDAKRGDIGNTNAGYVNAAFIRLGADAITVHPYLGQKAMQPFLDQKEKGIFVLCRTSNEGAGEFQDIDVICLAEDEKRWGIGIGDNLEAAPLNFYQYVALRVAHDWNANGNCALVVGATYPDELREVRKLIGDMPLLIPGVGAQGGSATDVVPLAMDSRGEGFLINSSRGIIFASDGTDFADVARQKLIELNTEISQARERKG